MLDEEETHGTLPYRVSGVGIETVEKARDATGLVELDIDFIAPKYDREPKDLPVYIELTEEIARRSKLFYNSNWFTVWIPKNGILHFSDEVFLSSTEVLPTFKFNPESFHSFWADSGFFKEWKVEEMPRTYKNKFNYC